MLRFLLTADFRPGQVRTTRVPGTRRIVPEIEAHIDAAWAEVSQRPGVRLFDGPVCRFEGWRRFPDRLEIDVSRTSYRILTGTNFLNPHFADRYGPDVMGNSMGVSTGLLSADGHWLMGRRNQSVAYYPGRVHPFAGSIEVRDAIDIFDDAQRELREEIHLPPTAFADIVLHGLAEDTALRHPEAIFSCRSPHTLGQLIAAVDRDEHDGTWSIPHDPFILARAVADPELTPVARAVLLLGGRHHFGPDWFAAARLDHAGLVSV